MLGGGPGRCSRSTSTPPNTSAVKQQVKARRREMRVAAIDNPASNANAAAVSMNPKDVHLERRMPAVKARSGAISGSFSNSLIQLSERG